MKKKNGMPTLEDDAKIEPTSTQSLQDFASITMEQARLIARNPSTKSGLLEKLSYHSDIKVRVYVAKHPNTPQHVLRRLALGKGSVIDVCREVAKNPNTSTETLDKLSGYADYDIQRGVVQNQNTSKETLEKHARQGSGYIQHEIAENPKTPVEILKILAFNQSIHVRGSVATNPNTPHDLIFQLIGSIPIRGKYAFAANPTTHVKILEELAKDKDPYVHLQVAQNPNTPTDLAKNLLRTLATIREHKLGGHYPVISNNPATPGWVLELLSERKENFVREAVAKHQWVSAELLAKLADDPCNGVRKAVAENKNTPLETLWKLTEYVTDRHVQIQLATDPNTPIESVILLLNNKHCENIAAKHPSILNISVDTLQKLATSSKNSIRRYVALHPATPPEILRFLRNSKDYAIPVYVAENQNTPKDLLDELAEHPLISVRSSVAENQNAPKEALARLATDSVIDIRLAVAENKNTPVEILMRMAKDRSPRVREAVAAHSNMRAFRPPNNPVTINEPARSNTDTYSIPQPSGYWKYSGRYRQSTAREQNDKGDFHGAPVVLDKERIAALQLETEQTSKVLAEVFNEPETPISSEATVASTASNPLGLDPVHLEFLRMLLDRPLWSRDELLALATQKKLMLDGILEHLNEAVFDYIDEALTEGQDPVEINTGLLGKLPL